MLFSFSLKKLFYFSDSIGHRSTFETISVIEFIGDLQATGSSSGHYKCDVKDKNQQSWFRTNDNAKPIAIDENEVSKQGYVVLMRKKADHF